MIEFSPRQFVSDCMQVANHAFRLNDWTVIPDLGRIERGSDVRRIKPKSMEVLECLARARGAVVSRNELFDAVWPGMAVSDDVLTNSVVELRKAFGDSAKQPRFIETIPKKGFRLVSDVLEVGAVANDGVGQMSAFRAILIAVVAASALLAGGYWWSGHARVMVPEKSIAVLPFVNMSQSEDQEYFADGLSEELITRLSRIDGLLVSGRTSSFHFKGRNDDLRAIGQALSVRHVLEGSVRKADSNLRITAQLIDVDTGFHLWSDTYDRPYRDIFSIQEDIAEAVATALSVTLNVGRFGTVAGGTRNVEAFEEFMLGSSVQSKFTAESTREAIRHFQRATQLDPGFVLAWDRLANIYRIAWLTLGSDERDSWWRLSEAAIAKAMELSPDADYVLHTAAYFETDRFNWLEAQRLFDQAAAHSSGMNMYTHAHVDMLLKTGKVDEALPVAQLHEMTDPLNSALAMYLGQLYLSKGRIDVALATLEAGMNLPGYGSPISTTGLVTALASGRADQIGIWLDRAVETELPGAKGVHTEMRARFGIADEALRWLRAQFEAAAIPDYYIMIWASYYGDVELAINALQRSPDLWSVWTPLMAPVRKTAEFRQFLVDVGLVDYFREYGWNDFCEPVGAAEFRCR